MKRAGERASERAHLWIRKTLREFRSIHPQIRFRAFAFLHSKISVFYVETIRSYSKRYSDVVLLRDSRILDNKESFGNHVYILNNELLLSLVEKINSIYSKIKIESLKITDSMLLNEACKSSFGWKSDGF